MNQFGRGGGVHTQSPLRYSESNQPEVPRYSAPETLQYQQNKSEHLRWVGASSHLPAPQPVQQNRSLWKRYRILFYILFIIIAIAACAGGIAGTAAVKKKNSSNLASTASAGGQDEYAFLLYYFSIDYAGSDGAHSRVV
jgi:hypothetical protein